MKALLYVCGHTCFYWFASVHDHTSAINLTKALTAVELHQFSYTVPHFFLTHRILPFTLAL